jgi:hypothetical protein
MKNFSKGGMKNTAQERFLAAVFSKTLIMRQTIILRRE